jgi:hypothetical protein
MFNQESLIPNQFNIEGWNKKKYQFKKITKVKKNSNQNNEDQI